MIYKIMYIYIIMYIYNYVYNYNYIYKYNYIYIVQSYIMLYRYKYASAQANSLTNIRYTCFKWECNQQNGDLPESNQ